MATSSKKTYVLFVSFLILLIFVILFEIPSKEKTEKEGKVSLYPDFSFEKAASITFSSPDSTIVREFSKENGTWKVKKDNQYFPVDPEIITSFSSPLEKLSEAVFVSTNPERFSTYNVDETQSWSLVMMDSNKRILMDLLIGKPGAVFGSEYVRVKGNDQVALIETSFKDLFNKDADAFRDKRIITLENNNQISKLFLESDSGRLEFEKQDEMWKFLGHEEEQLDTETFENILTRIRTLRIQRFVYEIPENTGVNATEPTFGRFVIKLTNGTKKEVWFGELAQEGSDDRYVLPQDTAYLGVIYGGDVSSIFKTQDQFIKKVESKESQSDALAAQEKSTEDSASSRE